MARAAACYHNTAVIIGSNGDVIGHYRKMHILDDPRYYEKFYFTPGDLDFVAHPTSYGTMGVLVCWDQGTSGTWPRLKAGEQFVATCPPPEIRL